MRAERQPVRTVYTLGSTNEPGSASGAESKPRPIQIKTGISDGIMTELVEGLAEGAVVVTGSNTPQGAASPRPNNPFSGGGRRPF